MRKNRGNILSNSLINTGNVFFRWRSYIPLILLIFILPKSDDLRQTFGKFDTAYDILCLLISLTGELIRILTVGFVPSGTSGRNTKSQRANSLNTTGIYSITRNPLYMGNYFIILGITILSRSWELFVINSLFFTIFYVPIILAEEEFLLGKFGEIYRSYALNVPCFFPRLSLWQKPENSWSWKMVGSREHNSVFAIILSFSVIEHLRLYLIAGGLDFSLIWLILGVLGMLVWMVFRLLKIARFI